VFLFCSRKIFVCILAGKSNALAIWTSTKRTSQFSDSLSSEIRCKRANLFNHSVVWRRFLCFSWENNYFHRNNFTIIEPIELIGQGGLGNLQIGQSEFPIILEVSPDHYEFCLSKQIDFDVNQNICLFCFSIRSQWKSCLGEKINIEKYGKYADNYSWSFIRSIQMSRSRIFSSQLPKYSNWTQWKI